MADSLHGTWDQISFCPDLFSLLPTHKAKLWFNSLLIKEKKRLLNGITFTELLNRKPNKVGNGSTHLQTLALRRWRRWQIWVCGQPGPGQPRLHNDTLSQEINKEKKKKEKEKWCFKYRRWVFHENRDGQCIGWKLSEKLHGHSSHIRSYSSICSPNILIG